MAYADEFVTTRCYDTKWIMHILQYYMKLEFTYYPASFDDWKLQ
jgi:hypothetical protein